MDAKISWALETSWHKKAAVSSLERWLAICKSEKWNVSTDELASMVKVFGASWYFTRFIYFRGIDVLSCFRQDDFESRLGELLHSLSEANGGISEEERFQQLRIRKNEAMLYVLVAYLRERINQRTMEQALTRIANKVIIRLIDLSGLADGDTEVLVLGMGRLAGYEMNYGSDLDLIFLVEGGDEFFEEPLKKIRRLLRIMPLHEPSGYLYDIDMRLRPHGNSGTLITPLNQFLEFHRADREIWERQMMTRHRCVYGDRRLGEQLEMTLTPLLYRQYPDELLAARITEMRGRIEKELGRPKGKYEIKRGIGGIMDIDFLTHYFQLLHGCTHQPLQTCSTRNVLQRIGELKLMDMGDIDDLSDAYDYLKRVECALRVFDMKSASQFYSRPETAAPLARALGHMEKSDQDSTDAFLCEYQGISKKTRDIFNRTFSTG